MDETTLERYVRAGVIARKALDAAAGRVVEGVKLADVVAEAEGIIKDSGAGVAFPMNISIDAIAAHYTPIPDDPKVFERGQVVKLDLGAHVDGCIADTATTVEVGTNDNTPMVNASREALRAAIELVQPGVRLEHVGKVIEDTIRDAGFSPIINLTGHTMRSWELHAGKSVYNVRRSGSAVLEKGEVVAIEPFATNGEGRVGDSSLSDIYRIVGPGKVRMRTARQILDTVLKEYRTLPFARRMLVKRFGLAQTTIALKQLVVSRALHNYSILKEHGNGIVTQAEHTVVVLDDPIVTTA
ncbi:MAG: type II methionyl aminopeptidase [Candidatus Undinarchaeales archaeon]|jgi:methionyl aminopeptidase|nr:type II methionyl aminopeptidase [Candidatus Undinarchaeales archaeon]MDP7493070.1 type II methionyl aminopeptidase [Candidatus Undinarchaeales archaeon]